MTRLAGWICGLVLLVRGLLAPLAADAAALLVTNARIVDLSGGAAPSEPVSILIRDGRIAAVGAAIEARDVAVLDVSGAFVLPGFIDAHVHLASIPGADIRQDAPQRRRWLRRQHLRAYLACGVTTVLEAGTDVDTAREVQSWLAAGHPGPTVLTLGPPIAYPGGYMSGGPGLPVGSEADLDRVLDVITSLGAVGVKVPMERGFGSDAIFPIHPPAQRAAIVQKATARGLPIYVHASDEAEQMLGLDMQARGLMHLNFAGKEPSAAFMARIGPSGASMVTTFSCIDAGLTRWQTERLKDPVVREVVPEDELRTAASPDAWAQNDRREFGYAFPRLPGPALSLLA
jgi:imidazolonepropionase-like amidohydrolase